MKPGPTNSSPPHPYKCTDERLQAQRQDGDGEEPQLVLCRAWRYTENDHILYPFIPRWTNLPVDGIIKPSAPHAASKFPSPPRVDLVVTLQKVAFQCEGKRLIPMACHSAAIPRRSHLYAHRENTEGHCTPFGPRASCPLLGIVERLSDRGHLARSWGPLNAFRTAGILPALGDR